MHTVSLGLKRLISAAQCDMTELHKFTVTDPVEHTEGGAAVIHRGLLGAHTAETLATVELEHLCLACSFEVQVLRQRCGVLCRCMAYIHCAAVSKDIFTLVCSITRIATLPPSRSTWLARVCLCSSTGLRAAGRCDSKHAPRTSNEKGSLLRPLLHEVCDQGYYLYCLTQACKATLVSSSGPCALPQYQGAAGALYAQHVEQTIERAICPSAG